MKLLSKKLLICIGAFCLFTTSVCFADNYNMVSEHIVDDTRIITYDNGKEDRFLIDEPYIINEKDVGELTTISFSDDTSSTYFTNELNQVRLLKKNKTFLANGGSFKTIKNDDGSKSITELTYIHSDNEKELIKLQPDEYIKVPKNGHIRLYIHNYLANRFFPDGNIYTKEMAYAEKAQANKERLQAQYAEAHEKAEEKRQAQQAKQEEKKAELNAKAGAKKSYEEASVEAAKNNAIDPSIVSDKTIREYIELYNGKSGVNDPSQHKLAKIGKANYIIVQLKSVNYVFDIDGYKAYVDDIYESAKEALNELKSINNSTSQINAIVKRVDNDAKTFAVGDTHKATCKQLCNAKSKELKDYVKILGK